MSSVRKTLLILFILPIVISLLIVVLYESNILSAGIDSIQSVTEIYWVGAMEVITICFIPVSLRLLKFDFAKKSLAANPTKGLVRWGTMRLYMLALPMLVNTILYYQFMNVAFGYLAIIGLLCMAFVYPSAARCEQDMNIKS